MPFALRSRADEWLLVCELGSALAGPSSSQSPPTFPPARSARTSHLAPGHLQGASAPETPRRVDARPEAPQPMNAPNISLGGQHRLALERDREIAKLVPALVILDQKVAINLVEATLDAFDDPVDVAQVALDRETIVLGQLLRDTLELRVVADTLQPRFNGLGAGARQRRLSITRLAAPAPSAERRRKPMDTSSAAPRGSNRPAVPSAAAGLSIAGAPRGRTAFVASAHSP